MKLQAREWLNAAHDDLVVIDEIIENESLTHVVAFHAQQCVEKCLKAIIEEFETRVIRTHNLIALLESVKRYVDIDIDEAILDTLDKLYIDSRYPGEFGLLPNGKPSNEDASEFSRFAQDVYTKSENVLEEQG